MSQVASRSPAPTKDPPFEQWEQDTTSDHRVACLRVARGLLRDDQMAEDAVQEAFLSAWLGRARFDPARSTQRSWLIMLTHGRAVDRIRLEQRRRDAGLAGAENQLLNESGRTCGIDPSEAAVQADVGQAVRAALLQLPVLQRETLMLAYWGGYTQNEIARLMDCPLGTVKTRCLSGMRRLRTALESARALDRSDA